MVRMGDEKIRFRILICQLSRKRPVGGQYISRCSGFMFGGNVYQTGHRGLNGEGLRLWLWASEPGVDCECVIRLKAMVRAHWLR